MKILDLKTYLAENNTIQYPGYTKPTDAKRYLNPKSFHPRFVFDSVPYSQLLRTIRNNSTEETRNIELDQCVQDFIDSGYKPDDLQMLKDKAIAKNNDSLIESDEEKETLVFPVHYFQNVKKSKDLICCS